MATCWCCNKHGAPSQPGPPPPHLLNVAIALLQRPAMTKCSLCMTMTIWPAEQISIPIHYIRPLPNVRKSLTLSQLERRFSPSDCLFNIYKGYQANAARSWWYTAWVLFSIFPTAVSSIQSPCLSVKPLEGGGKCFWTEFIFVQYAWEIATEGKICIDSSHANISAILVY